jgi:hypothetical protein
MSDSGENVTVGSGEVPSGFEGLLGTSGETATVGGNGESGLPGLAGTPNETATVGGSADHSPFAELIQPHDETISVPAGHEIDLSGGEHGGGGMGADSSFWSELNDATTHLDNTYLQEFNPSPEDFDTHQDWVDHTDYTPDSHGDFF